MGCACYGDECTEEAVISELQLFTIVLTTCASRTTTAISQRHNTKGNRKVRGMKIPKKYWNTEL